MPLDFRIQLMVLEYTTASCIHVVEKNSTHSFLKVYFRSGLIADSINLIDGIKPIIL